MTNFTLRISAILCVSALLLSYVHIYRSDAADAEIRLELLPGIRTRICQPLAHFAKYPCGTGIRRIDQTIMNPLSIASRGDQAGAAKICEVTRDFRLVCLQDLDARAHTNFIVSKELDQTQAGRIGEGLKE